MGRKVIDITGIKYGKLTVISFSHCNKYSHSVWKCKCECGNYISVEVNSLKRGSTKSCGCIRCGELNSNASHLMSSDVVYLTWARIIQRCNNKNDCNYQHYGQRGIKVCEDWLKFENFYRDMGKRPEGMSIDRIDVNGDYCKENCKWSTKKEQANNKTSNVFITFENRTKTLAEWSEELNIKADTIRWRMKKGWATKEIFNTPARKMNKRGGL